MASITTWPVRGLEGAARLDAQLYQPDQRHAREVVQSAPDHTTLGRIASVFRKGIFYVPPQEFSDEGVPYIGISALRRGLVDPTETRLIRAAFADEHAATELKTGDIAISKTAYAAASLITLERCNVSQDIIAMRIADRWKSSVPAGFLAAFLNTKIGLKLLGQWFQGNVQMHLSLPDARRVPIPIWEKLPQAVDRYWRQADDEMRSAYTAFSDAVELITRECALPSRSGWPNHFQASAADVGREMRWDAEHYSPYFAALRAAVTSYSGGSTTLLGIARTETDRINPRLEPKRAFKYVELADVNGLVGLCEGVDEVVGAEAPTRARIPIRAGQVLMSSVAGSLDRVALVDEGLSGAVASTGFFVLNARTVEPEYLLALVANPIVRDQLMCESGGSILASVRPWLLRKVLVPMIGSDLRREVVDGVRRAHDARRLATHLLEAAVGAVEVALRDGESSAIAYLTHFGGRPSIARATARSHSVDRHL